MRSSGKAKDIGLRRFRRKSHGASGNCVARLTPFFFLSTPLLHYCTFLASFSQPSLHAGHKVPSTKKSRNLSPFHCVMYVGMGTCADVS